MLSRGFETRITSKSIVGQAHPLFIYNIGSVFERHHRFVGWIGLMFTWAFVILGDTYNPDTRTWNLSGVHLVRQQDCKEILFGMQHHILTTFQSGSLVV